ncbi:hypothetical protein [Yinghuangia seranimata]|uniref:hypothetical protein n=1 Tax=Yinghuangia seranimata TaxID=408067 RepID=UPI00248BCFC9|nr:hypothetical protein [Yinghuangia seranimata]MDI2132792.1 hypothetical protein [Yinghuangia seranimata]
MFKAGLVVAATAAAVVGIGAMVGVPMANEWSGRHEQESSYPTGEAAKAAHASVPSWLPDGATKVRYKTTTTGDDRLLAARLPGGALPADCVPAPPTHHRPKLHAGWFPKGSRHKATVKCGAYTGFTQGGTLYAWAAR